MGQADLEPGADGAEIQTYRDSGTGSILTPGLTDGAGETQRIRGGDLQIIDQTQGKRELEGAVKAYLSQDSLAFLDNTGDLKVREDVVEPLGGNV